MVSCDWSNDGSVGVLLRHDMVSGLRGWGEGEEGGGLSAIPGSGYETQRQNHVARLQGTVL